MFLGPAAAGSLAAAPGAGASPERTFAAARTVAEAQHEAKDAGTADRGTEGSTT